MVGEWQDIAEFLGEKFGIGAAARLRKIRATGNSSIFVLEGGQRFQPLLVKHVHSGDASLQFDSLLRAQELSRRGSFRTPEPIALFVERNLICQEYVAGKNVAEFIVSPWRGLDSKRGIVEACGRWLSRLHQSARVAPGFINCAEKLSALTDQIDTLVLTPAEQVFVDRLLGSLSAGVGKMSEIQVDCGLVHGDFKPENLLWTEKEIVGIDILFQGNSPQVTDVMQFSNNLLFMALRPKSAAVAYEHEALVSAMLASYGDSHMHRWIPLYEWLRTHHLASHWIQQQSHRGVFQRLQNMLLQRHIAHRIAA